MNLQLTLLLAEVGLNIQEAHAFSTTDGYSLDVFVVDGWPSEVLSPYFLETYSQKISCIFPETSWLFLYLFPSF